LRIRHLPTGIVAQASENRSQFQNREVAMERLRVALERRERKVKKRISTRVPKRLRKIASPGKRLLPRRSACGLLWIRKSEGIICVFRRDNFVNARIPFIGASPYQPESSRIRLTQL